MKNISYCIFISSLLCLSCEAIVNTPEAVVRQYQAHYDKNEFKTAAVYCTPAMQQQLIVLEEMLAGDLDSTLLETEFLKLDCAVRNDSAFCLALLKDQYETYPASFLLLKVKKDWLVDLPVEESIDYNEEVLDNLDKLIRQ